MNIEKLKEYRQHFIDSFSKGFNPLGDSEKGFLLQFINFIETVEIINNPDIPKAVRQKQMNIYQNNQIGEKAN